MTERSLRQGVVVLGATGSVGRAAADVLRQAPDRFRPIALAAARQGEALLALGRELGVRAIALVDAEAAERVRPALRPGDPELRTGEAGLLSLLGEDGVDVVLQAIAGAAGLAASLETLEHGHRLALANKESMVVAGPLLTAVARRTGAAILPVDSEHSALFQCLQAGRPDEVRRLILTASGGPLRGATPERLLGVTPAEALDHPTWTMGRRITIDSATLMNKALEVIEARWLFEIEADRIEVVVHPQSIVHSMVEFVDGSIVAQLGPPDMRLPIHYALTWPQRAPTRRPPFDVRDYAHLTFEVPDRGTFPALDLGYEAARRGGTAGAALNAADEIAVQRFLDGEIAFPDIPALCAAALSNHPFEAAPTLDDLRRVDAWARNEAKTPC